MSGSYVSQAITVDVEITDQEARRYGDTEIEFDPTQAKLSHSVGLEPNYAKIEGYTESPERLKKDALIEVFINGSLEFTGRLKSAKLNRNHLAELHVYGVRYELSNANLNLNPQENIEPTTLLESIFADTDYQNDVEIFENGDLSGADFVGSSAAQNIENVTLEDGFTNASALRAIDKIASRYNARMWTDKTNTMYIDLVPGNPSVYEANLVIEIPTGSQGDSKSKTLVKGEGAGSTEGSAATGMLTSSFTAPSAKSGDEDEPENKAISDTNITTQEEANVVADNKTLNQVAEKTGGRIKHVGTTRASVYDDILVPKTLATEIGVRLTSDIYQINNITHTVSTSDGFQTEYRIGKRFSEASNEVDLSSLFVESTVSQFNATGAKSVDEVDAKKLVPIK